MTKRIDPLKKAANLLKKAGCFDFLIAAKRPGFTDVIIYGKEEPLSHLLLKLQNNFTELIFKKEAP